MGVPCVRVAREEGEATRRRLAAADLVDEDHEIVHEDGSLYLPVTDPAAVPEDLDVVERTVPTREGQTTPADLLETDPTYERIGDLVIVDEDDPERARELAAAILESDVPVRAVLNRASKVKGRERVRDWEVLATADEETNEDAGGHDAAGATDPASATSQADLDEAPLGPTETIHREYGCAYRVDLATAYFSPRLATERHRVAEQVSSGEHAFDMFAGVGPFVVPFARRGADCVAVDVNEDAVAYCRANAERNGVADRVRAIAGDVRDVAPGYEDWADRLVMNLPHSAGEFLESAVTVAGDEAVLHYYDIQHEDDPYGPGEAAIRAAAAPAYDVSVETRHTVRSYAPHELNVVLDVRLTR